MTVDMFERNFLQELQNAASDFPGVGPIKPEIRRIDFPAWSAVLDGLTSFTHGRGYHLPTFEQFVIACEDTFVTKYRPPARSKDKDAKRFKPWFDKTSPVWPDVRNRLAGWYASGMAEWHLYAALAEALEDEHHRAIVLKDPRVDWKHKIDMLVVTLLPTLKVWGVDIYSNPYEDRPRVEAGRETVERERKVRTMKSSHWTMQDALAEIEHIQVTTGTEDKQTVHGIPLCGRSEIDRVIATVLGER